MLASAVLMVAVVGMGVVGPSVGGTLGNSLGGTVGDGFYATVSVSVSVSVSSGIRVGGVNADVEDVGVELGLVDLVFLYDWRM